MGKNKENCQESVMPDAITSSSALRYRIVRTCTSEATGLGHVPVMLTEVLQHLQVIPGGVYVDATLGYGGYTRAILERGGHVIGIEQDEESLSRCLKRFSGAHLLRSHIDREAKAALCIQHGLFSDMHVLVQKCGLVGTGCVDGIVFDLGMSSMQIDDASRGFSFRRDLEGPLDMRMSHTLRSQTAADVVNESSADELAAILREYGDERHARLLAKAILRRRETIGPFSTTQELGDVVARARGKGFENPSVYRERVMRTFQALRIYVNDELHQLKNALIASERMLKPGGRLVAVSYHSGEDRLVKRFLQTCALTKEHIPAGPSLHPLTKRPVLPSEEETSCNPRSRSAKLRAAERTGEPSHFPPLE